MPNKTQAQRKQATKGKEPKAFTAQDTIPYQMIWPDGLCKMSRKRYSKSIMFEDINYQLAGTDDQESAFDKFKDFYNFFDASVDIQLSDMWRKDCRQADEI